LPFAAFRQSQTTPPSFIPSRTKTRERVDVLADFLGGQDYRQQSLIR
jgi:hypothetical protein